MTSSLASVAKIETKGSQGAFFSRREIPFHKLGVVVPDDITSKEDVLKLAVLDNWNVTHQDLQDLMPDGVNVVQSHRLVVRDNPWFKRGDEDSPRYDVLGVVRGRHEILQNEELADFAESLLVGGRYETAGSLLGGTRVFMAMALDSELVVDAGGINETISSYLVLSNSHDGSTSLTAAVTNIRPVCVNTLDYGIKNAKQRFAIRHTKSMEERMAAARETLKLAANYNERFVEEATELVHSPVSDRELLLYVDRFMPIPDDDASSRAKTFFFQNYDIIERIWNGPTIEGAGIKNTKYGVLQTLTEFSQWNRRVLKGREENFYAAGAGFDDIAWKERQKIHDLVLAP